MLKPSPDRPTIKQCLDDPKFLSRFTKGLVIPVNEREDCWGWKRQSDLNKEGYYTIRRTIEGKVYKYQLHRVSYEFFIGEIPENMCLDHLCRNRGCLSPWHVEVVTSEENVLRGISFSALNKNKTHCIQGHEFSDSNIYWSSNGRGRQCKACTFERDKNRKEKKRALLGSPSSSTSNLLTLL